MKSYLILMGTRGISAISQMVLVLLLANSSDAGAFGIAMAAFSALTIVAAISDFGLGTYSLRAAARADMSAAVGATKLATRLGLICAVVSLLVLVVLGAFEPALLALSPLSVWAVAERNTETRNMIQLAVGQVHKVGFLVAGRRIASIPAMLLLNNIAAPSLAFSLSLSATSAAAWGLSIWWTRQLTAGISRDPWRRIWDVRAFGLTGISGQIRNLDTALVTVFASAAAAGVYGLGIRIGAPLLIVYNAVSNMTMAEARQRSNESQGKILSFVWAATSAGAVAAPFAARLLASPIISVVPWLRPEDLYTVGILASMTGFVGLGIVVSSALVNVDQEKFVALNSVLFAILALLSIIAFASVAGILAAACAATTVYLIKAIVLQIRLIEQGKKVI